MKKDTKILSFRLKLKKITPFHCREKDKFTSVFRKDTFSGVYNNFSSFVALEHKFGLVYILLHKSFTIVSDFSTFQVETLKKNAYRTKYLDKCRAKFTNNIFVQKPVFTTVQNWNLELCCYI